MAALTPERLLEIQARGVAFLALIDETDPVVTAPVDPEAPTPAEVEQVSAMLDAANGTLAIVGSTVTDTTTTAQEKVDLILQTLGITS